MAGGILLVPFNDRPKRRYKLQQNTLYVSHCKELLEEMAMLQQRFAVHGQNAPDASTLTEAAARFTQATKQTTSARERLARKMHCQT